MDNTIKVGMKNLLLHKLRSLLTMLGVILGVGSVISMLAIGEGSKREALEKIKQLGATNVIIRSVKPGSGPQSGSGSANSQQQQRSWVLEYGLKYNDFERLKATLPTIRKAVPIALLTKDARHKHRWIPNARILGTTPDFLEVKNLRKGRGRFLTNVDLELTHNVAVLAAGAANELFKYEEPLGEHVQLGDDVYLVVGVLSPQGSGNATPGAIGQQDYNNDIYIPITCARGRFGQIQEIRSAGSRTYEMTELHEITLSVHNEQVVSQTAAMARSLLDKSHPEGDDFKLQVPLELLHQAEQEKRIWNIVLGSIAGISLLVGGIGIMNIMLASVTERTREIGIRRALGARRWDITFQFLVETILLSSTGGLLGIALGLFIPVVVTRFSEIDTVINWWSVLLSFGISVGIGIVFGMYPARRAALMDPIEALRHE